MFIEWNEFILSKAQDYVMNLSSQLKMIPFHTPFRCSGSQAVRKLHTAQRYRNVGTVAHDDNKEGGETILLQCFIIFNK